MQPNPILEYSGPQTAPPRRGPGWVVFSLMLLTAIPCLYSCFGMMDTWTFAREWKHYGQNPALLPQIEASVRRWTTLAIVLCLVYALGWSVYFMRRKPG